MCHEKGKIKIQKEAKKSLAIAKRPGGRAQELKAKQELDLSLGMALFE